MSCFWDLAEMYVCLILEISRRLLLSFRMKNFAIRLVFSSIEKWHRSHDSDIFWHFLKFYSIEWTDAGLHLSIGHTQIDCLWFFVDANVSNATNEWFAHAKATDSAQMWMATEIQWSRCIC